MQEKTIHKWGMKSNMKANQWKWWNQSQNKKKLSYLVKMRWRKTSQKKKKIYWKEELKWN